VDDVFDVVGVDEVVVVGGGDEEHASV